MDKRTVHIVVDGKVQGVFYRATTKETADSLGITGWVKNREDGCVEMMASGTDKEIEALIAWCWEGPKRASVTNVIVADKESEIFTGFSIIK